MRHSYPNRRDATVRSAGVHDRVWQGIRESHGGRLHRVWSTDFFIDMKGTLERIEQSLSKALEEDRAQEREQAQQQAEARAESAATVPGMNGGDRAMSGSERPGAGPGEGSFDSDEGEVETAPEDLGNGNGHAGVERAATEMADPLARVARRGRVGPAPRAGSAPPTTAERRAHV